MSLNTWELPAENQWVAVRGMGWASIMKEAGLVREGDLEWRLGSLTWYIGDLIRWSGLWSGREFHRGLAGRKGGKKARKREKERRVREAREGWRWGSPSLLPRLNCLNSIPFTSFVCFSLFFFFFFFFGELERERERGPCPLVPPTPHAPMSPSPLLLSFTTPP